MQLLMAMAVAFSGSTSTPTDQTGSRTGRRSGCLANEEAAQSVNTWTSGRGADAVLITAASDSTSQSNWRGKSRRVKGRVVVVGSTRRRFRDSVLQP